MEPNLDLTFPKPEDAPALTEAVRESVVDLEKVGGIYEGTLRSRLWTRGPQDALLYGLISQVDESFLSS